MIKKVIVYSFCVFVLLSVSLLGAMFLINLGFQHPAIATTISLLLFSLICGFGIASDEKND